MDTKNKGCCNEKGTTVATCSSRFTCSPCLVIWGTVLFVMIVEYFMR
jgi:hypothetical protein